MDKHIIPGPITKNTPATVNDAKYFSGCRYRSKVVMDLIKGSSSWIDSAYIIKTLMNTVKEDEYEELSKLDLGEFAHLIFLSESSSYPEYSVSQKFLRVALDKMLTIKDFSCTNYFHENRALEDGGENGEWQANIEHEAKIIAEKHYEAIEKDIQNNKVGTIKRATNELSNNFNHFRLFDTYEWAIILAHGVISYEKHMNNNK